MIEIPEHVKEKGLRLARAMHTELILRNVREDLLPSMGIGVLMCGDCDRRREFLRHLEEQFLKRGLEPRIHIIAINGGALRLAPNSPANKLGRTTHLDLLDEIEESTRLKNLGGWILQGHFLCGKAYMSGIPLPSDCHPVMIKAKRFLKSSLPDIKAACFFSVAFGEEQKTYHLPTKPAECWYKNNGERIQNIVAT